MSHSADELAAFEARAAEAEARLDALESGAGGAQASESLRLELLTALRSVREELGASRWQLRSLEAAKAAAEASARELAAANAKLEYRVLHLVRSLREADEKCWTSPPPLVRFSTDPFHYQSPLGTAPATPPHP
jgi:hypothetical protein